MCPPHPGVPVPSPHAGLLRLSAADSQQPHASTHVDLLPAFRRRLGRQGLNCIHCFYELYPCSFIFLTCYPDVPGVYVHHVVLQYKSKSVGYRVGVQVGSTVITHRQLDPYEARIQAMSVVAACAKGLMYFQSEVRRLAYYIH